MHAGCIAAVRLAKALVSAVCPAMLRRHRGVALAELSAKQPRREANDADRIGNMELVRRFCAATRTGHRGGCEALTAAARPRHARRA